MGSRRRTAAVWAASSSYSCLHGWHDHPDLNHCMYQTSTGKAKEQAYCPYSQFRVGAAVLTSDETMFTGEDTQKFY